MKLNQERRWWLKGFREFGWSMGRPMLVGIKKWDAHTAALVKMGYLEKDGTLYRVTDTGRAALQEKEGER